MIKRSELGLIEKELAALEQKQTPFRLVVEQYRKKFKVKLHITVPAKMYLRTLSLMEHLPDSQYTFEITDVFEMLANDILEQYGAKVSARQLYLALEAMQGNAKANHYTGETVELVAVQEHSTVITIPLPYQTALNLEWLVDDMIANVEFCTMTVEQMLAIVFSHFTKQLRMGEIPDVAKKLSKFARGGESA